MSNSDQLIEALQKEWKHLLNEAVARIQHCVLQLSHDQIWWQPAPGQNSIGILIRHLAGNLNQWVVDGILQRENIRDRQGEFGSGRQESAEHLIDMLCQVVNDAIGVLWKLKAEELLAQRTVQGFEVTGLGAIMHSIPHFVGHTHQITQLTRLQLGDKYTFQWKPGEPRGAVPL